MSNKSNPIGGPWDMYPPGIKMATCQSSDSYIHSASYGSGPFGPYNAIMDKIYDKQKLASVPNIPINLKISYDPAKTTDKFMVAANANPRNPLEMSINLKSTDLDYIIASHPDKLEYPATDDDAKYLQIKKAFEESIKNVKIEIDESIIAENGKLFKINEELIKEVDSLKIANAVGSERIKKLISVNGKLVFENEATHLSLQKALSETLHLKAINEAYFEKIRVNKATVDEALLITRMLKDKQTTFDVLRKNKKMSNNMDDDDSVEEIDEDGASVPEKGIVSVMKSDAKLVAKRVAARKVVNVARDMLVGMMSAGKTKKEVSNIKNTIGAMLQTDEGKAVLSMMLGSMLPAIKMQLPEKYHSVAEDMAQEFRVEGMAHFGTMLADFLTGPAFQGAKNLLTSALDEAMDTKDTKEVKPTGVRVSVDREAAKQEHHEEENHAKPNGKRNHA